ncbi:MAG: glycosyltransferase, partial [Candidatus Binatia bacterium]
LVARAPVVWNLRHSDFDPSRRKRTFGWTVSACARLSRIVPARIVSCSEESLRVHAAIGYPAERMVVIPNGFDLDRFRPDPDARAALRREIGVPDAVPLVGLVGRYHAEKDHRTFFAAAARLYAARPDARFLLCGPKITWETPDLVAEITAAGLAERCILLGRRDDMARINAALDVACSSSATEGFPNVIGEAMACGVPCVATDVGDSARIVGDTGRIVPRRDPEALAAALREVLDLDPARRRQLGLAARRRVEERFSLSSVVARYEDLYREVAVSAAAETEPEPEGARSSERRGSTTAG